MCREGAASNIARMFAALAACLVSLCALCRCVGKVPRLTLLICLQHWRPARRHSVPCVGKVPRLTLLICLQHWLPAWCQSVPCVNVSGRCRV